MEDTLLYLMAKAISRTRYPEQETLQPNPHDFDLAEAALYAVINWLTEQRYK